MKRLFKSGIKRLLRRVGLELVNTDQRDAHAIADLSEADRAIVRRVSPFTLTSFERRASLLQAVDHIVRHRVTGAVVECGVWRGGSMMAVALALRERGDTRDLWLYDTFEGMTAPTDADVNVDGTSARSLLNSTEKGKGVWCEAGLEDVRANLASTGYPPERVHYVQGKVEDTIPANLPDSVALLRLDTDWYESTLHELRYVYPLLVSGGVLVIDDYGHWQGARKAVDEYFGGSSAQFYLHRVDNTARLLVKP